MAFHIKYGSPEKFVPSVFCKKFNYKETQISYDIRKITFRQNARGCILELPVLKGEHFYGLGLQLKTFELTGKKLVTRVNADPISDSGDSHAPVPFFVSTLGYGIYFDTARYVEFEFGKQKNNVFAGKTDCVKDNKGDVKVGTDELYAIREIADNSVVSVQIPVAQGVDIYIFEGETITDIVKEYNMMSGGGCQIPEWGLGVYYRCYGPSDQNNIEKTIDYFSKNNIPLSVIGLEPGWQTTTYSCSFKWNKERFPDPEKFIKSVYDRGLHLNLWEHAFTSPQSDMYNNLKDCSGDYLVWNGLVPDFATKKAQDIFIDYHKKNVIYDKIDGFKLDECDGSDYTGSWTFPLCSEFPSGLDGEQYHSLFGTLYMQTMLKALDGKPTYSEVRNVGALASSYPFVVYSDLYDYNDFIRGICSAGLSGILWTPEVRHADSGEEFLKRLQLVIFSPQCLINGWYCEELPFIKFGIEKEVKFWLKERIKLIPRLKTAFDIYNKTGKPVARPLISDYTFDKEVYGVDNEFLLGEDLLVAPALLEKEEREIYIPQGNWKNYFTGEKVESGKSVVKNDKISVFLKEN